MLIFLDTEYTDSLHINLISIAMVTEDGSNEFYAELNDFVREDCSPFVQAAVLPLLTAVPHHVMNRISLTKFLQD